MVGVIRWTMTGCNDEAASDGHDTLSKKALKFLVYYYTNGRGAGTTGGVLPKIFGFLVFSFISFITQ